MIASVIGVDPGTTAGIGGLLYNGDLDGIERWHAWTLEVDKALLATTLQRLLAGRTPSGWKAAVAIEAFVVRRRAARLRSAGDNAAPLVMAADQVARAAGWRVIHRRAVDVKPWATDARLLATGLGANRLKHYPHGADGLRHALYAAVKDLGALDPLMKVT